MLSATTAIASGSTVPDGAEGRNSDKLLSMSTPGSNGGIEKEVPDGAAADLAKILTGVQHILFIKPDFEMFDASFIYELVSGTGNRLFYVRRKSPSKFQELCNLSLLNTNGDEVLRFMNPRKHPKKLIVRQNKETLGTISKINWGCQSPKFRLKNGSKKLVGYVRAPKKVCSCALFTLCGLNIIGLDMEIWEGNRKKGLVVGTISKDADDLLSQLRINFMEDVNLKTKALLIAAAIFMDFFVYKYST